MVWRKMRTAGLYVCAAAVVTACASQQPPARLAGPATVSEVQVYEANEPFEILPDRVVQGDRYAVAEDPRTLTSHYFRRELTRQLEKDLGELPQLSAPNYPLMETLYNLALEESLLNEEADGTFRTGALWAGVWTRDIAYAVHLGLGPVFPELSQNSLLRKVNDLPEIIQDTGTGGAWPVSTDRVVWAIAAWDLYKVTGDQDFLNDVYEILSNTAERDLRAVFSPEADLFYGESSFLDWREQTYPLWMNPVDIFEGFALGTLVGHAEMYGVLSRIGRIIGAPQGEIDRWESIRSRVAQAIDDTLWMDDLGYHSGYTFPPAASGYDGAPVLNQQSDSLGAALSVLTGVAGDRASEVVAGLPVVTYGVPSIYPQNPHAPPYHNKGIWPFVVAYYTWAGAEVGNDAAVTHGMQSLMRAAALFTTNKENMVYDNGHSVGTQLNSDRQLWSVAGFLTNVYRVVFGLDYQPEGLRLRPFVPQFLEGPFELTGLQYRDAVLNIRVSGKGNVVASMQVNGEQVDPNAVLPADLQGQQNIEIILADNHPGGEIAMGSTDAVLPLEPVLEGVSVTDSGDVTVSWEAVEGAESYEILRNGTSIAVVDSDQLSYSDSYDDPENDRVLVYAVRTLGGAGSELGSLTSAYEMAVPSNRVWQYSAPQAAGTPDEEYVELEIDSPVLTFTIDVDREGEYALRFRFANGHGPINTENKAALRSVYVNGQDRSTLLMPQLGEWVRWEYSNSILLDLPAGSHEVEIRFEDGDQNMHGSINGARIEYLRVIRME